MCEDAGLPRMLPPRTDEAAGNRTETVIPRLVLRIGLAKLSSPSPAKAGSSKTQDGQVPISMTLFPLDELDPVVVLYASPPTSSLSNPGGVGAPLEPKPSLATTHHPSSNSCNTTNSSPGRRTSSSGRRGANARTTVFTFGSARGE
ncbi:hypothetical protein FRC19_005822 [Serendipita sp. 401]|nr:hypothetical protein FRC19_005822 [Serendipita sp. 401]